MNLYQPSIEIMKKSVEDFIKMKTGYDIKIVFNNPFDADRHFIMMIDAYKMITYGKKEDNINEERKGSD